MNMLTFPSEAELNEAAAGVITDLVRTKPHAVIGLATGGTPVGIYRTMIRSYQNGMVSYQQVTTFNLDEYVGCSVEDPQSYACYMQEHLFRHIDVQPMNIHIPDGSVRDPEAECRRYDERLEAVGQLDLQLLGLGHNGHIGFNEPDHSLISSTHVVALRDETRQANARFFDDPGRVPTHAITMGVGAILKAKKILLVVKGSDKADIVHRALTGEIKTECPASLLQTHPNLVVMMDEEAGRHFR